jgi:hypothetical protein
MGDPVLLITLNFTNEFDIPAPEILMTTGVASTNSRLPVCAEFTMISTVADTTGDVPAEAVMMRLPVLAASAAKVTEAIPFTVVAVRGESCPALVDPAVIANVTVVPSDTALFRTFRTSAVMFVLWPLMRFGLTAVTEMDAGLLVIEMLALWISPPTFDDALIVTGPELAPE